MTSERRGVAQGMAAGLLVAIVALAVGLNSDAAGGPTETLGAAVAILGSWIAATVGNVARLRFFDDSGIGAAATGADPLAIRIARAVAQNTLEQAVIAGFAYAALTYVAGSAGTIALLVGCFSLGRVLFWTGYARGAAARAFGFALTFYPSVLALLVVLVRLASARFV
ncbi:MAG: MAPEG family protein [Sphingomonas sp.]|nr:MAG: MAPEG family protein [Sphingomonas sp.]